MRALVSPLTVSNYALFVCCERGSQRWRRERQATTLSLHLLAVKSRLLSLLQRELRQISVKSGRYHGNGQETGEVTVCQRIPPKLRAIWQGLVRWGSWVATFTSMHNTPTIKTLLCVRHDTPLKKTFLLLKTCLKIINAYLFIIKIGSERLLDIQKKRKP